MYTDLALVTNASGTFILAANFGAGASVEVYNSVFAPAALPGAFTDPNLPAGFAPYAIHTIGSTVYVTYMLRDTATYQETLGPGIGIVDAYDVNGQNLKRAITGGTLNAPWGMALAPAGFGSFGGDLLVGNFGDGAINVYDPTSYTMLGQLSDANGNVIKNPGLWEIVFGQTSPAVGDPNTLYFSAGLDQETHGLFGSVAPVTATPAGSFAINSSANSLTVTRGQTASATLSLVPSNGFNGTVQLACSGLPAGTTCGFAQSSLAVNGSTAQTTLTISSSTTYTPPNGYGANVPPSPKQGDTRIVVAAVAPLAGLFLLGIFKRRKYLALLPLLLLALVAVGGAAGCGGTSSNTGGSVPTPTGTSQVTVTATSGSLSQSTVITLTVQ